MENVNGEPELRRVWVQNGGGKLRPPGMSDAGSTAVAVKLTQVRTDRLLYSEFATPGVGGGGGLSNCLQFGEDSKVEALGSP